MSKHDKTGQLDASPSAPVDEVDVGSHAHQGLGSALLRVESGIICYSSPEALHMLGYTPARLINMPVLSLLPQYQPDGSHSAAALEEALRQATPGLPHRFMTRVHTADGASLDVEVLLSRYEQEGTYYATLQPGRHLHDMRAHNGEQHVTDQLVAEGALMFRCSDIKQVPYYFNAAFYDFTGIHPSADKSSWMEAVHALDREGLRQTLQRAAKLKKKYQRAYRLCREDGSYTFVLETGIPIFTEAGSHSGFTSAIIDVSAAQLHQAIMPADRSTKKVTEKAQVLFKMSNAKGEFYYFSNQWLRYTGQPLRKQVRDGWYACIVDEDMGRVKFAIRAAAEIRKKYAITYRIFKADQVRWVHESGIPLYDNDGGFTGYISATVDITRRKHEAEERSLQKTLRDSEKKLHNSLEHSHLIAFSIDKRGIITFCNEALTGLTGKSVEELMGQSFIKTLFSIPNRHQGEQLLHNLIQNSGYAETFECQVVAASGPAELKLGSVVLYNTKGQISGATLVGENITEKKRMTEELRSSNEQLKELFDNANDLIQIFQLDGRLSFVNKIWREKLGYREEEIEQLRLKDIVHPDYFSKTSIALELILEGKNVDKFETVFVSKDGRKLFVTGGVNCAFKGGKPIEFKGIFHDITDRIRAEKAQALYYKIANMTINSSNLESLFYNIHRELNAIIDAKNFYVALLDAEHDQLNFPYYIDEHAPIAGNKYQRKMGDGITEYAMKSNKAMFLFEKDILNLQYHGRLKTYGKIPKIWLGAPLKAANRVVGIIALQSYDSRHAYSYRELELLDFISSQVALAIERKQKEHQIYEQSARMKAILESGNHLIWSVDQHFNFTSYNQNYAQASRRFYCIDPLPGKERDVLEHDANLYWREKYKQVIRGESLHFETKFIDKNTSEEVWEEIYLNPIYHEDGSIIEVSGIAHDITEKKQSELALTESEEKFRNIFESFQDIYFRFDRSGRIMMVSPSVKEMLGYSDGEILNRNIREFFTDKKASLRLLRQLITEKSIRNVEATGISKSGKNLQLLCNLRLVQKQKHYGLIEVVARDVTRLQEAKHELQKAKELAEHSLKVKENFLANMSHEIRTPMNGIIGTIDLISGTILDGEQIQYVQTIKKSSETLLTLLNDILDLSKIEAGKMELRKAPVRLSATMEKLYALFSQQALSKEINLYYHLDDNVPVKSLIDETRLLQVLSNLTSNAIKFTDGGGSINISLKTVVRKGRKNLIKAVVSDSGIGISQENIRKLFSSFSQVDNSSTKTFGGTGLGLAISKELCKLMGGDIGVYSALGLGSSFWFTFEAEETDEDVINEDDILNKNIRISNYFNDTEPYVLIVDDNMVNRQVAGEILKKSGCRVDLAVNGQDAINKAAKNDYQIIFMDIQMPDMDGITATKKIKALGKKNLAPIVAMTAYSMKEDKERFIQAGLDDYVSKPIKAQALLSKVRELLKLGKPPKDIEIEVLEDEKQSIINEMVVGQLRNYGGNEMLQSVFEDFVSEGREQIESSFEDLRSGSIKNILINLHTLKGNSGTLGITQVHHLARDIEGTLKEKQAVYDELHGQLKKLKLHFEEFEAFYPKFLMM
jgi:PAS domain S-box-containing protein